MAIKSIYKKILRLILSPIFLLLFKLHILIPKIIIRVDGGICSQMHFYLIGRLFHEKGYHVEYDLLWYVENGLDMDGKFSRDFKLLQIFPDLPFKKATRLSARFYRLLFNYKNNYFSSIESEDFNYLQLLPPKYLSGYYKDPANLYQNKFKKYFQINEEVLDQKNLIVLHDIQKCQNSVAIHIRRGDLSSYSSAYGYPASIQYFITAVNFLNSKYKDCYYFIFSDEPDWCRTNIINVLPSCNTYNIIDINGSDKGYMDLILISSCKHQITSKGTLGKYGALLKKEKGEVIICDDAINRIWGDYIPNSVLIPS